MVWGLKYFSGVGSVGSVGFAFVEPEEAEAERGDGWRCNTSLDGPVNKEQSILIRRHRRFTMNMILSSALTLANLQTFISK